MIKASDRFLAEWKSNYDKLLKECFGIEIPRKNDGINIFARLLDSVFNDADQDCDDALSDLIDGTFKSDAELHLEVHLAAYGREPTPEYRLKLSGFVAEFIKAHLKKAISALSGKDDEFVSHA
jgi:hypothetical protein